MSPAPNATITSGQWLKLSHYWFQLQIRPVFQFRKYWPEL